ncbi:MAG: serine hydrolase [Colwellia sp.]|nr:serine hydrolase [Colwellia sp.]
MKKLFLIKYLFIGLVVLTCSQISAKNIDALKQILDQRINQQNTGIGIVIGLLHGEQEHFEMRGNMNLTENKLVVPTTLFEIGSISKTFTSLVLADMVIKGEVNLDDRVSKYLPDSVIMPVRSGKHITLRHLATHTSGLSRMPSNFDPADPSNPYVDYSVEDLYHFLSAYQLTRDIGEKAEYSNVGMGLLGHVLTLVANTDYESMIRKRILVPLNMHNTVIKFKNEALNNVAIGHDHEGKPTSYWDVAALAGAGAIRSSAEDMIKYLKLQMGMIDSDLNKAVALTHQFETVFMGKMKIGLAWIKMPSPNGEFIMHSGGTGGFASFIGFNNTKKVGVVILGNSSIPVNTIGMAYMANKLDKLLAMQANKARKKVKANSDIIIELNPELINEYIGDYQLAPGFILTISAEQGKLFAQATGQHKLALAALSLTEFANQKLGARMIFQRDTDNRINRMAFFQGGAKINALKKSAYIN